MRTHAQLSHVYPMSTLDVTHDIIYHALSLLSGESLRMRLINVHVCDESDDMHACISILQNYSLVPRLSPSPTKNENGRGESLALICT